jgi:hypothetical protein
MDDPVKSQKQTGCLIGGPRLSPHPCRQLNIIMKACIMPLLRRRLPKYIRRRRRQACACGLKIELVCNEKLTNGNYDV